MRYLNWKNSFFLSRVLLIVLFSFIILYFVQVKTSNADQEYLLSGSLCSYSGGSSTSTTLRLTFDGKGNFWFGSEYSWYAESDMQNGQVLKGGGAGLSSASAEPTGRYSVRNKLVTLHDAGGNHYFMVHMQQNNGRITEIMGKHNQTHYATGLCDENLYR